MRHVALAAAAAVFVSATAYGAEAATKKEPIVIPFISSQTGVNATFGATTLAGAQIAINELNASGGVKGRKVELASRDDRSDNNVTVASVRSAISAGQKIILGLTNTTNCLAAGAEAHSQGALVVADLCSSDQLVGRGRAFEHFFTSAAPSAQQALATAAYIHKRHPQLTAYDSISFDYSTGAANLASLLKGLEDFGQPLKGGEVLKAPLGTTSFSNQLSVLSRDRKYDPNRILLLNMFGAGLTNTIREADALKLFDLYGAVQIVGFVTGPIEPLEGRFSEIAGIELYPYLQPVDQAASDRFRRAYKKVTKGNQNTPAEPDGFVLTGYNAAKLLGEALKKVGGTDPIKVSRALEKVSATNPMGRIRFDAATHQVVMDLFIIKLKGVPKGDPPFKITDMVQVKPDGSIVKS